jgi:hypothetical protein
MNVFEQKDTRKTQEISGQNFPGLRPHFQGQAVIVSLSSNSLLLQRPSEPTLFSLLPAPTSLAPLASRSKDR